jgi:hypothetical protein
MNRQIRGVLGVDGHRIGPDENGAPLAEAHGGERREKRPPARAEEHAGNSEASARQSVRADLAAARQVHDARGPDERVQGEAPDRLPVRQHVGGGVHVSSDVCAHREAGGFEERAFDEARRRAPAERNVARPDGGLLVDPPRDVQDPQRMRRTVFLAAYRSAMCGS